MKLYIKTAFYAFFTLSILSCVNKIESIKYESSPHDLIYNNLAKTWDEGIPLGNGMIGALIWEKEGKLRFSLDRADLWDLRPMENLNTEAYKYKWVYDQWKKDKYELVQEKFDTPYNKSPAPSKIPGAALEFDVSSFGKVSSAHLYLNNALCEVIWENGVKLTTFVHANEPIGWYRFEGLKEKIDYKLVPPAYTLSGKSGEESPVTGQDLRRLGYPQGKIITDENSTTYEQEGWGGFKYQVHTELVANENTVNGSWSLSSEFPKWDKKPSAKDIVEEQMSLGMSASYRAHSVWWDNFWSKSALQIPNQILEKQWYLEQYKFASAARDGAPPISLQAVWTADNGKLPPWKGDFHHDLNTQLSYWSSYSANHLEEEIGFLNWLWKNRVSFKKYTHEYFEAEGLNVPGVTTLTGEPMGGWIQYSFGPTVSAWLGQHFYLHWRYSMDQQFLKEKAYPWIKDVALFLDQIAQTDTNGKRKLPISSSPEIHNNNREAWFGETTNYDLALILWTYEKAAEMADELGLKEDYDKWQTILAQWSELAIEPKTGLMIAPNETLSSSHRHFSHLMAYHPLGILDFSKGKEHQEIITNTIANLNNLGSSQWTGYSFSWLANLKARAFDGEGAAEALRIFATSFCLPNSFHVNGDQSGKGYSNFTYRPFTLEGNFAFAAGVQEMLIQSHTGTIHIFPAIPSDWHDVSFENLRTEGAFLVSAEKKNDVIKKINIQSLKGGLLQLKNPFKTAEFNCSTEFNIDGNNIISIQTSTNQNIVFEGK